jgi:hypothetical protein
MILSTISSSQQTACSLQEEINTSTGLTGPTPVFRSLFRCWSTMARLLVAHRQAWPSWERQARYISCNLSCSNAYPQFVYTCANGTSAESPIVLKNPFDDTMSFGRHFLHMPIMKNIITDTHFRQYDRIGRSMAFLARIWTDYPDGTNN